jgi:predicted transcriptional regulator
MFSDKDRYLDLDARKNIYQCISASPGLHFREIQRRLSIATGSLDYHLHFLHKNGLIRAEHAGGFIRYYPADRAYGDEEKELLSLLRQEKIRHILIRIMEKKNANATFVAEGLGISSSSLSPYLKLLEEKNIIVHRKKGRFRFYSVIDKKKIISALIVHKSSFLDKIVNNFIAAWEE